MSVNFRNATIAFAVVAVLLAAGGGIYFVATGGLDRAELIYHGNGGENDGRETVATYEHIAWGVDFIKPGYVLEGWNTSADGTGTYYKVGDYISYDKTVNVYAQWVDVTENSVIYVGSIKNDSDMVFKLTLHHGEDTVDITKYTYVVTKEDTAYITLETDYYDWIITTDGSRGFFADRGHIDDKYYSLVIGVNGNVSLTVDHENNMCMTLLGGYTELNIYMFDTDSSEYLTE